MGAACHVAVGSRSTAPGVGIYSPCGQPGQSALKGDPNALRSWDDSTNALALPPALVTGVYSDEMLVDARIARIGCPYELLTVDDPTLRGDSALVNVMFMRAVPGKPAAILRRIPRTR